MIAVSVTSNRRMRLSPIRASASLVLLLGAFATDRTAYGQAAVKNPTQPILIYQAQGHAGPVRTIQFDRATGQLLTGGLDKIVNVWEIGPDGLKRIRTIRPPIWRGFAGAVFSLDVSPTRDATGEALMAVAGQGVQASNGNISLFNFPGRANLDAGDLVGQLNGRSNNLADVASGHLGMVWTARFEPNGRFLATGGSDGSLRLWDAANRRQLSYGETGQGRAIRTLAFDAAGTRLWTADAFGTVILWDVNDPANLRQIATSNNLLHTGAAAVGTDDVAITAMTATGDGNFLIVGCADGRLLRIDAATLTQVAAMPTSRTRGQILALASNPKGGSFAVSLFSQIYRSENNQEPPPTRTVVELRNEADGTLVETVHQGGNRIQCLAFNGDGSILAFAGDDAQSVFVKRLGQAATPLLRANGRGASVWDVGFSPDNKTVGYFHDRDKARRPPIVRGFGLTTRQPELTPSALIAGARTTDGAWTIRAVDQLRLQVVGNNLVYEIQLPATAVRWWRFSLVPNPERPADVPPLVVAVCETEVRVYGPSVPDPNTGGRVYLNTRTLNGHSGPVLAVAPTSDGKWIATGGDDQTVRFWLTKGWESYPTLGAKYSVRDGRVVIDSVEPQGFADAMGLKAGDVMTTVVRFVPGDPRYDGRNRYEVAEEMWKECEAAPSHTITFRFLRGGVELEALTTKRDSPVASLFVGEDQEWVIWTPDGYYDTSVNGDSTYLGFHVNGLREGRFEEDSTFLTMERFEKDLRRPQLFDRLFALGDRVQAFAAMQAQDTTQTVVYKLPPALALELPGVVLPLDKSPLVVENPEIDLNVRVSTNGFSVPVQGLSRIRLQIDSGEAAVQDFPAPRTAIPPNTDRPFPFKVKLKPGLQRVSAVASNDADVSQSAELDVYFRPKAPIPATVRRPELHVATVGTGEFATRSFTPIRWVPEDLTKLSDHFGDARNHRYRDIAVVRPLMGKQATLAELRATLDELERTHAKKKLGPGDTVVLVLETHLVPVDDYQSALVPYDAGDDKLTETCVSTKEVSERLGKIAATGCHVLLILDVNHANRVKPAAELSVARGVTNWVRELKRAKVMTCVASMFGPSVVDATENNVLARTILVANDRGKWKRVAKPEDVMTLNDFKDVVERLVETNTEGKQLARFYEANTPLGIPFLTPPTGDAPLAALPMK